MSIVAPYLPNCPVCSSPHVKVTSTRREPRELFHECQETDCGHAWRTWDPDAARRNKLPRPA